MLLPVVAMIAVALTASASAHSGRTDENGGHWDSETGEYHYHHGYPAHDHEDLDGDGILDCPYEFDDKTNHSSNYSSGSNDASRRTGNTSRNTIESTAPNDVVSSENAGEEATQKQHTLYRSTEILNELHKDTSTPDDTKNATILDDSFETVELSTKVSNGSQRAYISKEQESNTTNLTGDIAIALVIFLSAVIVFSFIVCKRKISEERSAQISSYRKKVEMLGLAEKKIMALSSENRSMKDEIESVRNSLRNATSDKTQSSAEDEPLITLADDIKQELERAKTHSASLESELSDIKAGLIAPHLDEIRELGDTVQEKTALAEQYVKKYTEAVSILNRLRNELNEARHMDCNKRFILHHDPLHEFDIQIPSGVTVVETAKVIRGPVSKYKPYGDLTVYTCENGTKYHEKWGCSMAYDPVNVMDAVKDKKPCKICCRDSRKILPYQPYWYTYLILMSKDIRPSNYGGDREDGTDTNR